MCAAIDGIDIFLAIVDIAYLISSAFTDELWLRVALAITSAGFVLWGFWSRRLW